MITKTWTIQMFWTCKHCKTRNPGIQGKERESLKCSNCGAEKSTESWEMPSSPETAPALTGKDDATARLGPNWTCAYCKAESRANRMACEVCGASRKGASAETPWPETPWPKTNEHAEMPPQSVLGYPPETFSEPPSPPSDSFSTASSSRTSAAPYRHAPLVDEDFLPIRRDYSWAYVLGITALIVLGTFFLYWLFSDHDTSARVTRMTWERVSILEERHNFVGEGWKRRAPDGVYSWDHCETRQSGTESCNPHSCNCRQESYECGCSGGDSYSCNCSRSCSSNSNGSASCSESCSTCTTPRVCNTCYRESCDTCYDQCPVMEDWCTYKYYQWDEVNRLRLAGSGPGAVTPEFPHVDALQRVKHRDSYHVRFRDLSSDRTWDEEPNPRAYEAFRVGAVWDVTYTHAGGFTVHHRHH